MPKKVDPLPHDLGKTVRRLVDRKSVGGWKSYQQVRGRPPPHTSLHKGPLTLHYTKLTIAPSHFTTQSSSLPPPSHYTKLTVTNKHTTHSAR